MRAKAYCVKCYIDVESLKKTWPLRHGGGWAVNSASLVLLLLEGCKVTQTGYGLRVLECLQSVVRISGVIHGQTHPLWECLQDLLGRQYDCAVARRHDEDKNYVNAVRSAW